MADSGLSTPSGVALKRGIQELIVSEEPLTPIILRLSGPVVLMMYLQGAYNIIDTIWVGQLLGENALAGIAAGGFVLWSIFGLTNLISVGVMAKLSRRIGEEDIEEGQTVATRGLWYSFVLSIAVGGMVWVLVPYLFDLMGTDIRVTRLGTSYLRVLLLGCPFIFISFTLQRIFQAVGDTMTPMWLMLFTLIINAALDPLLMLGPGLFPRLEVAGAALATVIARFFMVAAGIWLLKNKRKMGWSPRKNPGKVMPARAMPVIKQGRLGLSPGKIFRWDWRLFGSIMRIGVPSAFSQTMFPVVYMIITRIPSTYGPEYIAALRIGHTVEGVSFFFAFGLSIAAAACVGQNLGAGKLDRAERSAWISTAMVSLVLFVLSVLFFLFPRQIGSVFTQQAATVEASAEYLRILALSQVFMGVEIVLAGAFSGAGDTVPPMAVSVPLNLGRIPLAYALAGYAGLGIEGVWWAISGTSIVKGAAMALWFRKGTWKQKRV